MYIYIYTYICIHIYIYIYISFHTILLTNIWHHSINQLISLKPEEMNSLTLKLLACIDDLCGWMQSNRLKLNADKTECIWVTKKQRQSTFAAPKLTVGGSIIVPTKGARNLGVFFDSKLDQKSHISNICRTCYFQLRSLWTVRRSLQPEILNTLLHAFVSCRLDYCNSLFARLPACDIAQLQSVHNAAARLFGGVSKYDSVTQSSVTLFTPIKERINFKVGVLTYKALNELAPSYLSEMLVPVAVNPALRQNRSPTVVT